MIFFKKIVYNEDLESDISHEAFGNLGKLFRSLASGSRPISGDVDHRLADQEAKKLFDVTIQIYKLIYNKTISEIIY